jgi:peptide-methionine (S)-S-oxide reductase
MAHVSPEEFPDPVVDSPHADKAGQSRVVLAGGCFWCVEAVYKNLDGVSSVKSGYAGGTAETADYETVSTGTTDHAESVEVLYDPSRISYGQILKVFFSIVTEIVPLKAFFEAETYHQDYAARNPLNPYIVFNAQPKVRKLRSYEASKEKVR